MDLKKILSTVDHTLLTVDASEAEIKTLCKDALHYQTASVCVPPSYVRFCADFLKGRIPVCTVIGFPNGYHTTAIKCAEAADAVENGADEIDMVINLGWLKDGKTEDLLAEINAVKAACNGKLLKVIVEACLLSKEELSVITDIVSKSDADFIKTSTGFSTGGATFETVEYMATHVYNNTKVKAAGGISSLEDAERFLALGAGRLGTSRIVKICKEKDHE